MTEVREAYSGILLTNGPALLAGLKDVENEWGLSSKLDVGLFAQRVGHTFLPAIYTIDNDSDFAFHCSVNIPAILPSQITTFMVVADKIRFLFKILGSQIQPYVTMPRVGGGTYLLESESTFPFNSFIDVLVSVDQDGDKILAVNGSIETIDTDTTPVNIENNNGLIELFGANSTIIRKVFGWNKFLSEEDIGLINFDLSTLPADIWFDSDVLASISDTAGDVTQWRDLSVNARHVDVAGTQYPKTGVDNVNGRNVLSFVENSRLTRSGVASYMTNGEGHFITILRWDPTSTNEGTIAYGPTSGSGDFKYHINTDGSISIFRRGVSNGAVVNTVTGVTSLVDGNYHILEILWTGQDPRRYVVYVDGIHVHNVSYNSVGSNSSPSRLDIGAEGANDQLKGNIALMVKYPSILKDAVSTLALRAFATAKGISYPFFTERRVVGGRGTTLVGLTGLNAWFNPTDLDKSVRVHDSLYSLKEVVSDNDNFGTLNGNFIQGLNNNAALSFSRGTIFTSMTWPRTGISNVTGWSIIILVKWDGTVPDGNFFNYVESTTTRRITLAVSPTGQIIYNFSGTTANKINVTTSANHLADNNWHLIEVITADSNDTTRPWSLIVDGVTVNSGTYTVGGSAISPINLTVGRCDIAELAVLTYAGDRATALSRIKSRHGL